MGTQVQVDIAMGAEQAYRRFCAVERVGEWVPGVAEIVVLERDDSGRPSHVRFTGMPARGSLTYELRYEYDDAARTVRWQTVEVALRDLRGEVSFIDIDDGRCTMTYGAANATSEALPSWARAVLDEESAESVAYAFRRWLERV